MPATPRGQFHRLPFGPSLRFGDARTVPMAPLTFKLHCSDIVVIVIGVAIADRHYTRRRNVCKMIKMLLFFFIRTALFPCGARCVLY
jgi:hypothetical protein